MTFGLEGFKNLPFMEVLKMKRVIKREMTFEEIRETVKQQYKNREIRSEHTGELMTVGDWNLINRNIRSDLKEMEVKCRGAFYNPNNMRIYIKQSFRKTKYNGDVHFVNSSEDYFVATGEDYYTDAEYFSVPAW